MTETERIKIVSDSITEVLSFEAHHFWDNPLSCLEMWQRILLGVDDWKEDFSKPLGDLIKD